MSLNTLSVGVYLCYPKEARSAGKIDTTTMSMDVLCQSREGGSVLAFLSFEKQFQSSFFVYFQNSVVLQIPEYIKLQFQLETINLK